jgi:8-oxo-dGTP pyrophosphatase MutT (NUDIX family)
MQRDPMKMHGGMWELSAGGSVIQGEDVYVGACRELQEETGVTGDLEEIGRVVQDENRTLYVLYLCKTNCPKDAITLQEGETVDYRWVTREELFAMTEDVLLSQRAIQVLLEKQL